MALINSKTAITRNKHWLQFLQFCLVGAVGYAINTGTFAASLALGTAPLFAAVAGFAFAVVVNFACNRHWTFAADDGAPGRQAARFLVVSVAGFLVGAALLQLLIGFAALPDVPAQAASIAAATPVTFLGNRAWSFESAPVPDVPAAASAPATPSPSTWLVLPTYNEAENLEPFVRAVLPQLAAAAHDHHVLIVDDASPDGTGAIADRLAAELAPVRVLHRPAKEGLGRAYAAGFARALSEGAGLVVQMDADFSHDPAAVPALIAAAHDADVVIGSRYVTGGGAAGLGLGRRLLSRGGCWYARTVLGVQVRDLTGGFKCLRREVLERVGLDALQSAGFGFQVELTYRALGAGARVREVPIRFGDRRAGASKMHARIVAEALWQLPLLRLRAPRRPRGHRVEMPRIAATMPTATSTSPAMAIPQRRYTSRASN